MIKFDRLHPQKGHRLPLSHKKSTEGRGTFKENLRSILIIEDRRNTKDIYLHVVNALKIRCFILFE